MRAILMLHGVDRDGSVLSLAPEELQGLLRAVLEAGHALLPLGRMLEEPDARDAIALTFDDGFASVAELAAPIVRRAGTAATLFLTTGYVGADNRWPSQPERAPTRRMLGWDQVEALAREGWEIAAHSRTHPDLCRLPDAELVAELDEPRTDIERHVGRRPELFAYPYGSLDDRVVAAVGRRYRYAVTTRMAPLSGGDPDPYRLPRIDAYYLRSPRVQRRFGRAGFGSYLVLRALLRQLRAGGRAAS